MSRGPFCKISVRGFAKVAVIFVHVLTSSRRLLAVGFFATISLASCYHYTFMDNPIQLMGASWVPKQALTYYGASFGGAQGRNDFGEACS